MDKIGVVGLGYVGLPLAVEFAKKYETVGFDISKRRIDELCSAYDRTLELDEEQLKSASKMSYTNHLDNLKDCNYFIITVPTPIDKDKRPDLSYLLKALSLIHI